MGTIAFLPWARLRDRVDFKGHFCVIPFDIKTNPLAPNFIEEWELTKTR